MRMSYTELGKAKITESRNAIVSERSDGGFTLAQQIEVPDGGNKVTTVFLAGAFHIADVQGLIELRNALNIAIESCQDSE